MSWYSNVYSVTRSYGGPEEGGWWYDEGEPVESRRFDSEEEAHKAAAGLRLVYPKKRWLSDEDFQIHVEEHFARSYPEVRPHYE